MAYTDIDDPSAYFQTSIYTGDGAGSLAITNTGNSDLQPDWLWIKRRDGAVNHLLHDSVRGVTNLLVSNAQAGDDSNSNIVLGFDSDGFRVGANSASNGNNQTFVAWQWKTGTAFTNDASSTGVGSIDSAGSVNTDAGFSIVSWNGNDGTIAHGLGVKPAMIIIKSRQTSNNWVVFHKGLGTMSAASNSILILNGDAAKDDPGAGFAEPTTSVFTIKGGAASNDNNIAYCFADVKGYSKFGSYSGDGASDDGPFIYLGFKPAFVMLKNADAGSTDWYMYDNKRGGPVAGVYGNNNKYFLRANLNNAEGNESIHLFSNGFQIRISNAFLNGSGNNLVYMAFAENPFVTSTGIPATAR